MADFNMTVTVSGLKLLTDALAGTTVILTGIHLGSGSYTGNLSAATQLVQEQIALPLERIIQGDNQITAKSVLQYETIETGFTWTEIGLFAKEADGPEILYAYGYAGNKGDYIPGSDETTLNEKVIRFTVLSSNDANIVAEVDGSTVYASQEDLDDLRESVELSITNITNIIQQVTGVDPDDPDAAPDGSMVVTLTHTKSGTIHAFTGLGERTGLVPCQFKSTAGHTEGDTATIDGTAYTITLTGADAPETDLFVSSKSIIVDVDTESKTINFKAGGGLTKAKLALATATEDTVFNGKTFYAGSKVLRTGRALATATNVTAAKMFAGTTAYNQQGQLITGNPSSTNVTAAKMFTGTTAFDSNGNLITGAPAETSAEADDIVTSKTAYDNSGKMLYGTSIGKVISGTMNNGNYVSCGGTIVAAAVYTSTHITAVVYPGHTVCALGNRSDIYGSIQLVGTTQIYWYPASNGTSRTGTYWIIYK